MSLKSLQTETETKTNKQTGTALQKIEELKISIPQPIDYTTKLKCYPIK